MDRDTLLSENKQQEPLCREFNIILDFNVQFRQVEKIIKKHWDILRRDRFLGSMLPAPPWLIYRKAPTLKDLIAPGVIDPPQETEMFVLWGVYRIFCMP